VDVDSLRDDPYLPSRLRSARRSAGLTQGAVAEELGVARTTVVALEKGERAVRPDELVHLSRLYGKTVDELLRKAPAPENFVAQFRTALNRTPEPDVVEEVLRLVEGLADDYRELERITGREPSGWFPHPYDVDHLSADVAGQDVAERERARLRLGDASLSHLRDELETVVGLRIFFVPMPPDIAGFFAFVEELGAIVATNANHPWEKQRWSLSHEYFHFLTNRGRAEVTVLHTGRVPKEERAADAFAREFLMPASGVRRLFSDRLRARPEGATAADVVELASFFGVALEAMTLRLEGLRLIPPATLETFRHEDLRASEAKRLLGLPEQESDTRVLPTRYVALAVEAYAQGLISESRFARFLHTDRVTAREVAHALKSPDTPVAF
jgi:Zn-dependent peptidase ImmA (M78 family)/DNA-binding XRE family transcriptional regulator